MIDRTVKPEPTGKISFNLPEHLVFTLKNNLQVYYSKKDTLPIVQVNLIIPSGSINDSENKNGLSTLTSMLIDEGAGKFNGFEISDRIEILGSILSISNNKEFTTISLLSLKENIKKSLEILSLVVQNPTFTEDNFTREKQKLKNKVLQLKDDPSFLASSEFQKILFSPTPFQYNTNGNIETLENISNYDVKLFYKNFYRPEGSYLIIVGNLNLTEAKSLSDEFFSSWNSIGKQTKNEFNFNKYPKQISVVNKPGAAQSELRIGHLSKSRNSNDFYARSLLNSILGGQFSSRINLNLREDKGYTYGAHSNYNYNTYCSTFNISTSVKSENTADAIKEVLNELQKIKSTVTQEEINFAKSYLIRRYPSLFETYSQVATNLSLLPIYNLESDYFRNYINNIEQVTLGQVLSAANENILLENIVITVVGDREKLSEQLKILSEFPIHFSDKI